MYHSNTARFVERKIWVETTISKHLDNKYPGAFFDSIWYKTGDLIIIIFPSDRALDKPGEPCYADKGQ